MQGLVYAHLIIAMKVGGQPLPDLTCGLVSVRIHILIFHTAPQSLHKDVVESAAAAIHADFDIPIQQVLSVLWAGEMTSLIAIPNGWLCLGQSLVNGCQHKGYFQCVRQLPGHDTTRIPIQNSHQIKPIMTQADVSADNAPNMIGVTGGDMPQQVRINRVVRMALAEVGFGVNDL